MRNQRIYTPYAVQPLFHIVKMCICLSVARAAPNIWRCYPYPFAQKVLYKLVEGRHLLPLRTAEYLYNYRQFLAVWHM